MITISGVVCREAGGEKHGGRAEDICFYDMARLFLKTEVLHARSPKGGPGSIFRQNDLRFEALFGKEIRRITE